MKFFLPYAKDDAEAEFVLQRIAKSTGFDIPACIVTDFQLFYEHESIPNQLI
uniref:Uncharacterized protein n=1 Tax=Cyanothece sp. (strain PCC 7425 / ATCC 29141) TaxID=395961 RepID=B8HT47_CYAP4